MSLAYALEETAHADLWKNRLHALGLGHWLRALKQAVLCNTPGTPTNTLKLARKQCQATA